MMKKLLVKSVIDVGCGRLKLCANPILILEASFIFFLYSTDFSFFICKGICHCALSYLSRLSDLYDCMHDAILNIITFISTRSIPLSPKKLLLVCSGISTKWFLDHGARVLCVEGSA